MTTIVITENNGNIITAVDDGVDGSWNITVSGPNGQYFGGDRKGENFTADEVIASYASQGDLVTQDGIQVDNPKDDNGLDTSGGGGNVPPVVDPGNNTPGGGD